MPRVQPWKECNAFVTLKIKYITSHHCGDIKLSHVEHIRSLIIHSVRTFSISTINCNIITFGTLDALMLCTVVLHFNAFFIIYLLNRLSGWLVYWSTHYFRHISVFLQVNFFIFIRIIQILVSKLKAHQMRYSDYKFRYDSLSPPIIALKSTLRKTGILEFIVVFSLPRRDTGVQRSVSQVE